MSVPNSDFAEGVLLEYMNKLRRADEGESWLDGLQVMLDGWRNGHELFFRISWCFQREQEWSYWGTEYVSRSGKYWPRSPTLEQCLFMSCEAEGFSIARTYLHSNNDTSYSCMNFTRPEGWKRVVVEGSTLRSTYCRSFQVRDDSPRYIDIGPSLKGKHIIKAVARIRQQPTVRSDWRDRLGLDND